MTHLVIMAAGTGGHVIPGIAVAHEMRTRGWSVSWLGTTHGMENRLVPPTGIPMDRIAFSGVRGKGLKHSAEGALRLVAALWNCLRHLRRRGADAVLGMGGYVCFPGGVAAKALLRKPLVLVNADASLLLSNRALLPLADRIAFGFDGDSARQVKRAIVTGNPVRAEIESVAAPAERYAGRAGPLRLLIVGGSLGAQALNESLPKALALWPAGDRPNVRHQTGQANLASTQLAYTSAGVEAEVVPFIDDMAAALAGCDVVVCRAGAITVSELCAAGVASVLVPFIASTTAHQRDNARYMAEAGAAVHVAQSELVPERLNALLRSLDRPRLQAMAEAARRLSKPKAAARVADEVERLVGAAR